MPLSRRELPHIQKTAQVNDVIGVVHQFTPAISGGDGVSQGVLFTQQLLISLGYHSNIYANHIDEQLQVEIKHIDEYQESADHVLIYHFSIGHIHHDKIMAFQDQKILAYHNITPAHFFSAQAHLKEACEEGRRQLKDAQRYMRASYSDSDYNDNELLSLGYINSQTLPLLVNIEDIDRKSHLAAIDPFEQDVFNIVFIGRIVSNKCQHQLVDTLFELHQLMPTRNVKLHLIGSVSEPEYMAFVESYIHSLGLSRSITIHGKVSDDDLTSMLHFSDLFLSLSEHEGFCMPALEAICHDVPVLAYDCGGISSVVKKETLLQYKAPQSVAKEIDRYIKSPQLLEALAQRQRGDLAKFDKALLRRSLSHIVESVRR